MVHKSSINVPAMIISILTGDELKGYDNFFETAQNGAMVYVT